MRDVMQQESNAFTYAIQFQKKQVRFSQLEAGINIKRTLWEVLMFKGSMERPYSKFTLSFSSIDSTCVCYSSLSSVKSCRYYCKLKVWYFCSTKDSEWWNLSLKPLTRHSCPQPFIIKLPFYYMPFVIHILIGQDTSVHKLSSSLAVLNTEILARFRGRHDTMKTSENKGQFCTQLELLPTCIKWKWPQSKQVTENESMRITELNKWWTVKKTKDIVLKRTH